MEKQSKNPTFLISCNNDKFWNLQELIAFLSKHQHQNIELTINPEAIDLNQLGLYSLLDSFVFDTVTIYTHNPFESHSKYNVVYCTKNIFAAKIVKISDSLHTWTKKAIFLSLFGRPTANRLALSAYLFEKYRNQSLLHFSAAVDVDSLQLYELDKLLQFNTGSLKSVATMLDHMPLLLESADGYDRGEYQYHDPLTTIYKDILVDVISESHVKGRTFFPTEKIFRPVWCKKPFIAFSSQHYLEYMRQMGFRTFGDFWDEDYDGYEGGERLAKIFKLIDFIANKSESELEKMYWDMQYTLDHNYQLLISQSYNTRLSEII